jgi:hypothetical protein
MNHSGYNSAGNILSPTNDTGNYQHFFCRDMLHPEFDK